MNTTVPQATNTNLQQAVRHNTCSQPGILLGNYLTGRTDRQPHETGQPIIEYKTCTKCGIEKPTARFKKISYYKKDGSQSLNATCRDCDNDRKRKYRRNMTLAQKEKTLFAKRKYRQNMTMEQKEKKRIQDREHYQNLPEEQKRIIRLKRKMHYQNLSVEQKEKRRLVDVVKRGNLTEEQKEKRRLRDRLRYQNMSGDEKEHQKLRNREYLNNLPEDRKEKRRLRHREVSRSEDQKEKNRLRCREHCNDLTDCYVASALMTRTIHRDLIPQDLINLKREHLKLIRYLKENQL